MMDSIIVPKGVRYISEWKEFKLPGFPCIIDKQIPGCGFTEWGINNSDNTILVSPRRILLENKRDQHAEEVLYVCNTYDDDKLSVDQDLIRKLTDRGNKRVDKIEEGSNPAKLNYYSSLKENIKNYISFRWNNNKPAKILVTYDSFRLVKEVLSNINKLEKFQVIVDEFQSIFTDSKFKSDTELSFLDKLQGINRLCYVSATPMLDKYLKSVPEFKNLPYYKLDWEKDCPDRIQRPRLIIKTIKSLYEIAGKIIESYKSGRYEKRFKKSSDDSIVSVESKEAVIYVNSVANILSIIKKSGLRPEEVNILCANTPENISKIKKKLGKDWEIGRVPLRGEQHKMFTFCTRTVYLGADFYSTCARTFVISDANIETLAVDISLDLPQILGRQRLWENPWKNCAEFYYKPIVISKTMTQEVFEEFIRKKEEETTNLLMAYNDNTNPNQRRSLANAYYNLAKYCHYQNDYVAVNFVKTGRYVIVDNELVEECDLVPVENVLVKIAEQRAFDIQQVDYKDRFSVFRQVDNSIGLEDMDSRLTITFLEKFESLPTIVEKLKFLCDLDDGGNLSESIINQITEKHFQEYFTILGSKRIRDMGYNTTRMNRFLENESMDKSSLLKKLKKHFSPGERYSVLDIKSKLREIYKDIGYNKTPVATDLSEFFVIKEVKIVTERQKRIRGFEIISERE